VTGLEEPVNVLSMTQKLRANVYIDGFNLYMGALSKTSYKWLDLERWAKTLMPSYEVGRVVYCTARLIPDARDVNIHVRQDMYLRAIKTLPTVQIYEGKFTVQDIRMWRRPEIGCQWCDHLTPVCKCCGGNTIPVIKREEKGSDVQLAIQLINDGYKQDYDVALVVSNDSDIQPAVDLVRRELGRKVIVADPRNNKHPSLLGDERRRVRPQTLGNNQLPATLLDLNGNTITKPISWA